MRRRFTLLLLGLTAAGVLWCGWRMWRAADAGVEGKQALLAAEQALRANDLPAARTDLGRAARAFDRTREELEALGPLGALLRVTPFVRVQLRAVEAYADAGRSLTDGAQRLAGAAAAILEPEREDVELSDALTSLRHVHDALTEGSELLDGAFDEVVELRRYRLMGPLGSARSDLLRRLPSAAERARTAADGVAAFLAFGGGDGSRRHLVFSQNPDEVRPTGGYLGSLGLLTTTSGRLELEWYTGAEDWRARNPGAVVPVAQAPHAFRIPARPAPQTISNVNAGPDWPTAARLALDLWERAGEPPIDSVLSITPEFLARLLGVLGAVTLEEYDETFTAANLLDRLDHHTHLAPPSERIGGDDRKEVLTVLAPAVLDRLLRAPASLWPELAEVVAAGLDAREAMVWSKDSAIAEVLATRGWDGAFPEVEGDFFYNAEFEYQAKNGRGLQRHFRHDVRLSGDGSAEITTQITIRNTRPFSRSGFHNIDSLSYITIYGPAGASFRDSSHAAYAVEEPVAGHTGVSWVLGAPPGGSVTFSVTWWAPNVAVVRADGSREYRLHWRRVPAHRGDVLDLEVHLPRSWRWEGETPPSRVRLEADLIGAWRILERDDRAQDDHGQS